jgi:hypothetical protein
MSAQDLTGRIWAALDASDGEVAAAADALLESFKEDPDLFDAALDVYMPQLRAVADPLAAPVVGDVGGWDDPRFGQALLEWFNEVENPTRRRRFDQQLVEAFFRALGDALRSELPHWRAAQGDPERPEPLE